MALCSRHEGGGNSAQTHSDHAALHGEIDEYSSVRVPELLVSLDMSNLNVVYLILPAIWVLDCHGNCHMSWT